MDIRLSALSNRKPHSVGLNLGIFFYILYFPDGCEQNESQVFITAKQDLFDIKIKPVVLKDENRTSIMAFAGSGDFLKTK